MKIPDTAPFLLPLLCLLGLTSALVAQRRGRQDPDREPSRAELLVGEYGRFRANNDLVHYDLDIRVDPEQRRITGVNTIRFRMLADDNRIQLDLQADLQIDKVLLGTTELHCERELDTVWVDFPEQLASGHTYEIAFHYSGTPRTGGRFGGFTFGKDPAGRPWIYTACEGQGARSWWPCKDQWRDEVDGMRIRVAVPDGLTDVSNGAFLGKTGLGDGYTRWDWLVQYPINSYCVSVNIGAYEHFADQLHGMPLDFYALPEDLDRAKTQFAQARPMLEVYEHWFGEYPFAKDGYKLVQVPYSGMEHQSAVTYGNRFTNGYLGRDWTGVGVSTKFDFIIIHESAHEWFGNAVSAADASDMWIHEGFATYLEVLYVESMFGYDDSIRYVNGLVQKVANREPIITRRGAHREPTQDQYFKGALFLHTLRSVVDDDVRWRRLMHDLFQHFKYQNIMTEDLVAYVNAELGVDLTPVFDQYLRHTALPVLELKFDAAAGTVAFRWQCDEAAFAMPVRVGRPGRWQTIRPTTAWATMPTTLPEAEFAVATELYYIGVRKVE
ncbi:MAG TPA: M1 family metallopeptidase [Planctomycetota bacterium]|nr:M1 family metallopeptidase [Planctomycetota bacterium]